MKGFEIRKADEAIETKLVIVAVYGKPGIGKTSLGFTMPAPCLHLDFDRGVHRAVTNRPDSVEVTDWQKFSEYFHSREFEQLLAEQGYRSLLVDTVGTMLDDCIAPGIIRRTPQNGVGGALSLKGWGVLSSEFSAFLARAKALQLNVFFTAHDKENGDDTTTSYMPAIKGGSMDILFRTCDLLGYMSISGGKRMVDFSPTERHVGKNVAALPALTVPGEDSPGFTTFMDDEAVQPTIARMNQKSEVQAAFIERIEAYRNRLAGCDNPSDFDVLSGELATEQHQLFKVQAGELMRKRLKDVGVSYSKETKVFEWAKPKNKEQ